MPQGGRTRLSASTLNLRSQPTFTSQTYSPPSSFSSGTSTALSGSPIISGVAPRLIQDDVLDVEVRVSAGRWAVEGQVLKWWYEVPAEGEPEREYSIEVRRRGGAIMPRKWKRSWARRLCPDQGCCIM